MARRKASSTVKVNMKDVETRSTPPEGDYLVRVATAEQGKSSSQNAQISFVFEIEQPSENKGNKLYLHCPLLDNSLWKLASVLTALGVDVPADEMEIDLEDLVDRKMMAVVHHETYNGKKQARLGDWAPADQFQGAEEEGGKKKKKSKKDKDAADEPAEEDTGKKSKKNKKSEDGPAEEKSSKKDKKGKKSKVEPIYESDEIGAMNAKKLQKVIDKHELDVDLDDYKTDRKKAGAVVDALEAAGLLKD